MQRESLLARRNNNGLIDKLVGEKIIKSADVQSVMRRVDRKHYAPFNPYIDTPQSIGYNATISAPHMHAIALEILVGVLRRGRRALDVGSGSGYLTVCMALLLGGGGRGGEGSEEGQEEEEECRGGFVVGIEHIPQLVELAVKNVRNSKPRLLQSGRVRFIEGDGRKGHAADAPYDAIHVGAACGEVPQELLNQLAVGGRLVAPVGVGMDQRIIIYDKAQDGSLKKMERMRVSFVPLTDRRSQWY